MSTISSAILNEFSWYSQVPLRKFRDIETIIPRPLPLHNLSLGVIVSREWKIKIITISSTLMKIG
jgi:hypothetical protein